MKSTPSVTRVLIVEANPAYADALREIVASVRGCEVLDVIPTADEALEAIEQTSPDVLITDVRPAGTMSGFALMWRVTQRCDCAIICVLSADNEAYREGAAQHGARACLPRECVAEEMPDLLRTISSKPRA